MRTKMSQITQVQTGRDATEAYNDTGILLHITRRALKRANVSPFTRTGADQVPRLRWQRIVRPGHKHKFVNRSNFPIWQMMFVPFLVF